MKIIRQGFLGFLLMVSAFAQAQQNAKVSGMAMEGATISLLHVADSSVAKLAIAGSNGAFEIDQLNFGTYRLSVSAVGFKHFMSEAFELSANQAEKKFSTITMEADNKELGAVTVVAKKPMIEIKPDRTIVNVDAGISNAGATAMEVLEKSPGVTVDRDGNISIKGRAGVMVMIDGKPSYLSGADLANLLNSMSANQLDQIEIMTNPPPNTMPQAIQVLLISKQKRTASADGMEVSTSGMDRVNTGKRTIALT